jgi:hypothetical protein
MAVSQLPIARPTSNGDRLTRRAALAGMIGAPLFGAIIVLLTVLHYDELTAMGWHPLRSSNVPWPSSLAIGPYGWLQTVNFVVLGFTLIALAYGLHRGIVGTRAKAGPVLVAIAGLGLILAGFKVEPDLSAMPRTAAGWLHLTGFLIASGALLPSFFVLGRRMRQDVRWHNLSRLTLLTGVVALVCWAGSFALPLAQVALYIFFAVVLAWITLTAIQLRRVSGQ